MCVCVCARVCVFTCVWVDRCVHACQGIINPISGCSFNHPPLPSHLPPTRLLPSPHSQQEGLASPQELASLRGSQHAMAAVDYEVSVAADVFLASYGGNMARAVEGHRRFRGHKRTIAPDR